jgi:hypothetical protein
VLGSAVVVGFGGIYAEILADTATCPAPLSVADAERMVRSLRGFPLLAGARGRPAVALDELYRAIVDLGRLAAAGRGAIRELDINPLIASERGVLAVDVLVSAGDPEGDHDAHA